MKNEQIDKSTNRQADGRTDWNGMAWLRNIYCRKMTD
jgi:hypothetical protein